MRFEITSTITCFRYTTEYLTDLSFFHHFLTFNTFVDPHFFNLASQSGLSSLFTSIHQVSFVQSTYNHPFTRFISFFGIYLRFFITMINLGFKTFLNVRWLYLPSNTRLYFLFWVYRSFICCSTAPKLTFFAWRLSRKNHRGRAANFFLDEKTEAIKIFFSAEKALE